MTASSCSRRTASNRKRVSTDSSRNAAGHHRPAGSAREGHMPKGFPKGRTAFLVIHGIGEQSPYETLDSFGRGMDDYLRSLDPSVTAEHRMASRQDPGGSSWTEHFVRLRPAAGDDLIDVHEFYWAYLSEEKISVSEIWTCVE